MLQLQGVVDMVEGRFYSIPYGDVNCIIFVVCQNFRNLFLPRKWRGVVLRQGHCWEVGIKTNTP